MKYACAMLLSLCMLACSDAPQTHDDSSHIDAGHAGSGGTRANGDAGKHAEPGATKDASTTSMTPAHDAGKHGDAAMSQPDDAGATSADASPHDDDAGTTGHDPDIVFNDPLFFSLPINSVRFGVSGYDAKTDLCISVIWYLSDINFTRYCSGDTAPMEPYVFIEASKPAGCWDYGPNADTLALRGCMDFGMLNDPGDDSVDLDVDVHTDLWSGTVRFDNSP